MSAASQPKDHGSVASVESDPSYDFRVSVTAAGPDDVIVRGYGQLTRQTLALLECVVATPRTGMRHAYVDLHEAVIDEDVLDDLLRLGRSLELAGSSLTIIGAALRFGRAAADPLAPTG